MPVESALVSGGVAFAFILFAAALLLVDIYARKGRAWQWPAK
jgi:hypothetical protein